MFHMQHDNARDYTKLTKDFREQNNKRVMPWPALSINPIENLWGEFQRYIKNVQPRPKAADELAVFLLRLLGAISVSFINRLIHTVYRGALTALASQL